MIPGRGKPAMSPDGCLESFQASEQGGDTGQSREDQCGWSSQGGGLPDLELHRDVHRVSLSLQLSAN